MLAKRRRLVRRALLLVVSAALFAGQPPERISPAPEVLECVLGDVYGSGPA